MPIAETNPIATLTTLLDSLAGKSATQKTSGGTSTTTTASNISTEGVQALLKQVLESTSGLAAVSSGQKTAGLYNSSTNQQLTNDLLTRVTGEIAARQAGETKTTTTTPTTTTSKQAGILDPARLLTVAKGLGVGSILAPLGKKLSTGVKDLSSTVEGALTGTTVAGNAAQMIVPDAVASGVASNDFASTLSSFAAPSAGSDVIESFGADLGGLISNDAIVSADVGGSMMDGLDPSIWEDFGGFFADGGVVQAFDSSTGLYNSASTTPETVELLKALKETLSVTTPAIATSGKAAGPAGSTPSTSQADQKDSKSNTIGDPKTGAAMLGMSALAMIGPALFGALGTLASPAVSAATGAKSIQSAGMAQALKSIKSLISGDSGINGEADPSAGRAVNALDAFLALNDNFGTSGSADSVTSAAVAAADLGADSLAGSDSAPSIGGYDAAVGGFANGGKIQGPGNGISDKVTIKASPGEVIIPKDVVDAFGSEFFDKIIQQYHTPAAVQRVTGVK